MLTIPHLRNYLRKRARQLSEQFKTLETDSDKIENLARQTEIGFIIEWIDKTDAR